MSVDAAGRLVLVDEPCRFCCTPSRYMHPAGVIAGRWTCTRCGRRQDGTYPPGTPITQSPLPSTVTTSDLTKYLEGID